VVETSTRHPGKVAEASPVRGLSLRTRLVLAFLGLSVLPLACLVYLSVVLPREYDSRDRQRIGELAGTLRSELSSTGAQAQRRLEELCKPGGLAEFLIKNYLIENVDPLGGVSRLESFAKQFVHLSDFDLLDLLDKDGRTLFSRHDPERYLKVDAGDLQALRAFPGRAVVRFEPAYPHQLLSIQSVVRSETWRDVQLIISAGYQIDQAFIDRLDRLTGAAVLLKPAGASGWLSSPLAHEEGLAPRLEALDPERLARLPETSGEPVDLGGDAYNLTRVPLYSDPQERAGPEPLAVFVLGRSRAPIENVIVNTRMFLVSMVLGVFLVSWIAAVLLSTRITEPIGQIVEGARKVASGDLDLHVEGVRGRELSLLVSSFNTMTKRLKESQASRVRAERIAAWQEIARRLAHEIKNPLFPIQLSIQNLKKTYERKLPEFDEIFEESTSTILQEVDRLKRIVNEFSQFARMPRSVFRPESLAELVNTAATLYRGLPASIRLELELSPGLPQVYVDREKILQVLLNLIKNAVEAMPEGGVLRIATSLSPATAEEDAPMVLLEVSDTGHGIGPEMQEQLFKPYFTTKEGGTGLGLSIVHRIVTDHGGRIAVESEAGKGTTFTVSLPTRPPAPESEESGSLSAVPQT
jgi:signal transduction histidine kinase